MSGQASVAAGIRSRPTMGVPVRLQHVLIIGAALVLALTGLPQRLDFLPPSRWVMDAAGGIELLRSIHRGAGAVLIGASLYHAVFVFFSVLANRRVAPLTMIPDARDYRDAIMSVLYFTGMRPQRPLLREPTYFEKLDYWVLAWGITAMGVTGIIRLFPARMTELLGGDVVAAALEFHSDVALLAVVWLVVIHLAYPALSPHRHEPEGGEGGP